MDSPIEEKHERVAVIGVGLALYWLVWTPLAVAAGLTVASATWVMPRHAALLTLACVMWLMPCVVRGLFLVSRAAARPGRQAILSLLRHAVLPSVVALNALTLWMVCPHVVSAIENWAADTRGLGRAITRWGYFTWYQFGLFVAIMAFVTALGFAVARLCRFLSHRYTGRSELQSSADFWFLVVAVTVGSLFAPLAVCGGFEACRRVGMLVFVATHGSSLEAALGSVPADATETAVDGDSGRSVIHGPFHEVGRPESGPVLSLTRCGFTIVEGERIVAIMDCNRVGHTDEGTIMLVTLRTDPLAKAVGGLVVAPIGCDRVLHVMSADHSRWARMIESTSGNRFELALLEPYKSEPVRGLFGRWYEQGPTLTFEFPWRTEGE